MTPEAGATATTTADQAAPDPARTDPGGTSAPHRSRRGHGLWSPLILIGLVLGAWLVWRVLARLDDIEARQLDWSALAVMTWQHVLLTAAATALVVLIGVPLGVLLTRPRLRRAAPVVVGIANAGQAAPSIGVIVLLAILLGFGFWTAVIALTVYAILPVLRNTITGLLGVDATLVEAGRGQGMSPLAVLGRVELPLAVPVIMSGVRTALVLLVGTASFGAFIDAGGLGSLITTGISLFRYSLLISGGVLIAVLALIIDWLGRILEHLARPKGM